MKALDDIDDNDYEWRAQLMMYVKANLLNNLMSTLYYVIIDTIVHIYMIHFYDFSALIECHLDSGRRQDASHIATAAAGFIKQHVPSMYKTVFGLMVRKINVIHLFMMLIKIV